MSTDPIEQAKQCFKNIEGALASVASSLEDVVMSTVIIPNICRCALGDGPFGKRFRGIDPARTVTCSPFSAADFKVEIEVTAYGGAGKDELERVMIALFISLTDSRKRELTKDVIMHRVVRRRAIAGDPGTTTRPPAWMTDRHKP